MQDEVNEKTVALSIKATKLTAKLLQAAIRKLLAEGKSRLTSSYYPQRANSACGN